jgi:hypothetical protein
MAKSKAIVKVGSIQQRILLIRGVKDSRSEFKDWASDVPGESFGYISREWGKNSNNKDKREMK